MRLERYFHTSESPRAVAGTASLAALGFALFPLEVRAQDTEPSAEAAARGNTIIVTARKREESLLDVPESVVAIGAEDIQRQNIKGLKRIRFWMTFGDAYITHLNVLQAVGMTRIDPVMYEGKEIVPLQFLKAVLPEPASLGPTTKGKTNIGCIATGLGKDGKEKTLYIYNICDHEDAYAETGNQAVSYTTGVPAMIGAAMLLTDKWAGAGVWNIEQFDPDPFMDMLNAHGLPWQVKELDGPLTF